MRRIYSTRLVSTAMAMTFALANAQDPKPFFELNTPETTTKNYVAREYVQLKPGFSFSAASGKTFSAKVDQFIVFPPTENTFKLANGNFAPSVPVGQEGYVVGEIPGSFDVSQTGAATYNIPIMVPNGINGMQPNISLVYNSQAGMGLAGYRMDLMYGSRIQRVPHSKYYDGTSHAISFDGNDRFALDGQQLMTVSGAYGNSNTTYGTEVNDYSRITSYGQYGDGPDYFKIETKDGITRYYGSSVDSKMILADKKGVFQWLLKKSVDANGNYIEYIYGKKEEDGETWIEEIRYTGNETNNKEPLICIKFDYLTVANSSPQYVAKNKLTNTKRLSSVAIMHAGIRTQSYNLTYTTNNRLTKITQTDRTGKFFNPTTLEWNALSNSWVTPNGLTKNHFEAISEDIDNDGKNELICLESGNYLVMYSLTNSGAWVEKRRKLLPIPNNFSIESIAISDISKENGKEFILSVYYIDRYGEVGEPTFIEVSDLIVLSNDFKTLYANGKSDYGFKKITGDFDGDGHQNLLIYNDESCKIFDYNLGITKSYTGAQNPTINSSAVLAGDFNNDGKTDILIKKDKAISIYTFEQNELVKKSNFELSAPKISVDDFNNDGHSDILNTQDGSISLLCDYQLVSADKPSYSHNLNWWANFTLDHYDLFNNPATVNLVSSWRCYISSVNHYSVDEDADGLLDIIQMGTGYFAFAPNYRNYSERICKNLGFEYYDYYSLSDSKKTAAKNEFSRLIAIDMEELTKKSNKKITKLRATPNLTPYYPSLPYYEIIIETSMIKTTYQQKTNGGWAAQEGVIIPYNQLGDNTELIFGDHLGDGVLDCFIKNKEKNAFSFYILPKGYYSLNHITKFKTGMDDGIQVSYKPLVVGTNYSLDAATNIEGITEMPGLFMVANNIIMPSGQTLKYNFKGAKIHHKKGFLGFTEMTTSNETTQQSVTDKYALNSSFLSMMPQSSQSQARGNIIKTTKYAYTLEGINKRYAIKLNSSNAYNNLTKTTTNTEYKDYDNSGNPRQIIIDYGVGIKTVQTLAYTSKGSWCDNKLVSSTINSHNGSGLPPSERTTLYEYDSKGNLTKITTDPGDKNQTVTEYPAAEYDPFGNPKLKKVTANGRTLSTRLAYTPSGRFLESVTDVELGKTVSYQYDETMGLTTSKTDETGTTTYLYDGFGRLVRTVLPNKVQSAVALQWAGNKGALPAGALYYSYSETSGSSPVKVWYDKLGREIRRDTYGLKNKTICVATEYNAKGQLWRVTEPYFEGENATSYASTHIYDDYGRISSVVTPAGTTSYSYNGLATTVASPSDTTVTLLNAAGQTISTATNGKSVLFTYWPSGLVKTSTPSGGTQVEMWYDKQGNRTKMIDPDAGVVLSEHNGFGQLMWTERRQTETSPALTRTDYTYHPTTGLLDKTTVTGNSTETVQYAYDARFRVQSANNEGKHKQEFVYDAFNRLTSMTETIGNEKTFTKSTEYDAFGRVSKNVYPSGYLTKNVYNANGYLSGVTDKNGKTIWEATEANARGQLKRTKQGGRELAFEYDTRGLPLSILCEGIVSMEYQFDANGNLESRTNLIKTNNNTTQSEYFRYDKQNRLKSWDIYQNGNLAKENAIGYDAANGNITAKTDIGSTMVYGENGQPPHALTSILGNPELVPDVPQTITYTDFSKIESVSENNHCLNIVYGVDQQRRKGIFKHNNQTTLTRYYLGDYEEEVKPDGNTRKIHYISAGNGLSAIFVQNDGKDSLYYCYTDYQGNLLAVTNDADTVVHRLAYDPWGARRNPDDWTRPDTRPNHLFARGYTMHEHLDKFGLINMNGRAYDPLVARFLNPDPFIQAPGIWENYNRYGYCLNNPLIYSDPTGNKWKWYDYFNPMSYLSAAMQYINDNTVGLRKKMVDAGVPDFNAGYNTSNGWGYKVGNNPTVYPREQRATTDAAILGRTTITFNEPIGQGGANFVANMGVPVENIRGVATGRGSEGWFREAGSWIYNNMLREGALQGHSNTANQGYINWSWKSDDVQVPIKFIGAMASFGTALEAYGSFSAFTRFFGAVSFVGAINTSSDLAGYQIIQSHGGIRDATFVAVDIISGPIGVFQTPAMISDFNSLMMEINK